MMRITNNILQREALSSMQSSMRKVAEAQRRAISGLRLQSASDDPSAAATSMRTRGSLRALDQYRRNIHSATTRVNAEESVLDQLTNVLTRAKTLALSQGTATASAETRQIVKAEVDELLRFTVSLGNTRIGSEYLFGGEATSPAPFDAAATGFLPLDDDGNPIEPDDSRRTEISAGQFLQATHTGRQAFLDSGALQALRDLSSALTSANPEGDIRDALGALDTAFDEVQNLLGEVGARVNQLEVTTANLDALEINLETLKSNIEEVDFEEAVTELVSRQTAYQAAMLATSKVMGLTLADYLR